MYLSYFVYVLVLKKNFFNPCLNIFFKSNFRETYTRRHYRSYNSIHLWFAANVQGKILREQFGNASFKWRSTHWVSAKLLEIALYFIIFVVDVVKNIFWIDFSQLQTIFFSSQDSLGTKTIFTQRYNQGRDGSSWEMCVFLFLRIFFLLFFDSYWNNFFLYQISGSHAETEELIYDIEELVKKSIWKNLDKGDIDWIILEECLYNT